MGKDGISIGILLLAFIIPTPMLAAELTCDLETTVFNTQTGQCVPKCGEGTEQSGKTCVEKTSQGKSIPTLFIEFFEGDLAWIAVGVVVGTLFGAAGILFTWNSRRDEKKKENTELIQKYGEQLGKIYHKEGTLATKQDCSMYAELFLDTLEEIASLNEKKMIRREVSDFFESQFRYGINLWDWYKQNVEKIPDELLNDEWKKKDELDRWYYFRRWCEVEKNV